jgi:hypothetical protein
MKTNRVAPLLKQEKPDEKDFKPIISKALTTK